MTILYTFVIFLGLFVNMKNFYISKMQEKMLYVIEGPSESNQMPVLTRQFRPATEGPFEPNQKPFLASW